MAVWKDAVDLRENGYATMVKSTVFLFELPSEFSPGPLTEMIQAGAKELLRTAVQAEVSASIADHALLLDEEGRQRLVRHGILSERDLKSKRYVYIWADGVYFTPRLACDLQRQKPY